MAATIPARGRLRPLSRNGTPVRPTLPTFVWARFDVTGAIMPPAITQFKQTHSSSRVGQRLAEVTKNKRNCILN